jgi:hypothetical protein
MKPSLLKGPIYELTLTYSLLCTITTRLVDTGQGYQRLQQCPRVRQEMNRILHTVQNSRGVGSWVGLSVVHLGDRDVPNGKCITLWLFSLLLWCCVKCEALGAIAVSSVVAVLTFWWTGYGDLF